MRHAPNRCDDASPPICPEELDELRRRFDRPWRPSPRPAPKPLTSKKPLAQIIEEARAACERMRARGGRVLVRDYGWTPAAGQPQPDEDPSIDAARRA